MAVENQFASRIPIGFANRMQKGNLQDPLLKQVLATNNELAIREDYQPDPLGERLVNPIKGLIHKYHGRVLLTLTGVCAVNCRYCFRRHFPYQDNNPGREGWHEVCQYIAQDKTITEVILSGGDPLLASNIVIGNLLKQLESIPHVHTVRFHTRVPVVLPERIDDDFLNILANTRLNKVVVLHANHAQELDGTVTQACKQLKQINCHLLNQSVLLAGVNDNALTLAALSQTLFALGVMPYYLHTLDKVQGAAHFDLPITTVKNIYRELQQLLPGYLLPKLVKEESGQLSKSLIHCERPLSYS